MSNENIAYGGQAVIGGVLIQSPKGWSLAVRDQKNQIHNYFEPRTPLTQRGGIWKTPFIRGVGALVDSLYVGYKGISLSDTLYYGEQEEESLFSKVTNSFLLVSILSLLIVGPRLLIDLLDLSQVNKGFAEGMLRGVIVITYIYLVGKTKDAQELFEYHGAEHMAIASFEADQSLNVDNIKKYPKEHIRCGTAFIFLIVFVSLLTLPFIPTLNIFFTLISRLLHVFLVAMISYEILKYNFKNSESIISKIFSTPGIWTQKITTKAPSDEQIEVAIISMANCIKHSEDIDGFDELLSKSKELKNG
ncbi:DUF1385 domain-containing protein [Acidimicrobiia bacterium]|jgi:uncharacterized protein YqhQ|nr:DUF1385 domain-containing protein [Acidimicrobiia bacterium]MDA9645846.1 DUF1385 domain-containing protein [Candidatus Actinomarina sp.]|tara:strand:- start:4229 stop:5140 length:912 start_codon:yes stop_codon:yes gene_type:complete